MVTAEKTKSNLIKCKCLFCPSYELACKVESIPSNVKLLMSDMDKNTHAEKLFCAYDKSTCITEHKGCLCASCAVKEKYELNKLYYCLIDGGQ